MQSHGEFLISKRQNCVSFHRLSLMKYLFLLLTLSAVAKPEPAPSPPSKVEQIDEQRVRIGQVTLNTITREISFPARVNYINSKIVEALVVHQKGRSHESIFLTTV